MFISTKFSTRPSALQDTSMTMFSIGAQLLACPVHHQPVDPHHPIPHYREHQLTQASSAITSFFNTLSEYVFLCINMILTYKYSYRWSFLLLMIQECYASIHTTSSISTFVTATRTGRAFSNAYLHSYDGLIYTLSLRHLTHNLTIHNPFHLLSSLFSATHSRGMFLTVTHWPTPVISCYIIPAVHLYDTHSSSYVLYSCSMYLTNIYICKSAKSCFSRLELALESA